MDPKITEKIIFALPENISLINLMDEILKYNNLEESDEEYVNKLDKGIEPRLIIVRDAAIIIAQKKFPEKKVAEFLAQHLKTSHETAEKIITEINEKLIPYARTIDLEQKKKDEEARQAARELEVDKARQEKRLAAQKEETGNAEAQDDEAAKQEAFAKAKEELYKKIGIGAAVPENLPTEEQEPLPAGQKNPDTQDVEKNAEGIKAGKSLVKDVPQARQDLAQPAPEAPPAKPDIYKENIE